MLLDRTYNFTQLPQSRVLRVHSIRIHTQMLFCLEYIYIHIAVTSRD